MRLDVNVKVWEGLGVNTEEGRQRLGKAVKVDRMRKFRTVDAARIAARVSRGAWENVEQGKSVKDFTLGAIEDALGWPAGRAQQIIDGEPVTDIEAAIHAADLSPRARDAILQIVREDQAERADERGAS